MSWMNELDDLLQQYRNASPTSPPADAQGHFAQVAQHAPPSVLSGGLAEAFRSQSTPPFGQLISQLFGQSNPAQQAGILNQLIASAGPAVAGSLLGNLGLTASRSVTPQQAQQANPEAVKQLAEQAQSRDPSIIDKASEFYAQHPTLVQGLGAVALSVIMSHVAQRH